MKSSARRGWEAQKQRRAFLVRCPERASPLVIVQGRDEEERGVIKIKDMVLGAEIASRATVDEWRAQPAQIEVARGELVNVVSRMLARL